MRKKNKPIPPSSPFFKGGERKPTEPASLWEKAAPLFVLSASFLICFWPWFRHFNSQVFLSLDMTFAYYPLYHWVHEHLVADKLPLISDLAYNGAPVAAVVLIGILSPALWLFHVVSNFNSCFNLLFLAPSAIYLFGTYFLGRRLGLSRSASVLLAFLWSYNGHQMAQLDHLNVTWAHAFFPWAFMALVRYRDERKTVWTLLAGFLWGLNLLSGHPQIVFLEGLFFLAWIFLSTPPLEKSSGFAGTQGLFPVRAFGDGGVFGSSFFEKTKTFFFLLIGALLIASPQILFTLECRCGEGFNLWEGPDKYFHSWTPLNFLTLVFPWFFGKEQFDRAGGDYWWQYQFTEMQVAFGIVGLFFILLFFFGKSPQRRWIAWTALFGLLMAFGKFFFLYPLALHLPFFSFFRDPARYWFLITWAVGLGAAYAWDEWFNRDALLNAGIKLGQWMIGITLGAVLLGWCLVQPGRSLAMSLSSWFIQHFIVGDGIHTQPTATYLARIPEKLDAISFNLLLQNPRVFLPIFFLAVLLALLFNRNNWNRSFQKGFLLVLLFADLMIFRMLLGNSFVDPSQLPTPAYPPPQNRSLVLLSGNVSPQPAQYAEMAFPNWNFISGRPNIALVANPHLPQYDKLLADLGWFSWVYKDRDPVGFVKQSFLLRALGVDQIVSDTLWNLPAPFKTTSHHYPYLYHLDSVDPPAAVWSQLPWEPVKKIHRKNDRLPKIIEWDETKLSLEASDYPPSSLLYLQKTLLPGWKALVNEKPTVFAYPYYEMLMTVPINQGANRIELRFEPVSLRLGFFLFFLFLAALACLFLRRRLA